MKETVRHEVKVEHIPCISEPPPKPPNIVGDKCPEALDYCLSKDKAWELAQWLESTILWMRKAWELCKKEDKDVGRVETETRN